MKKICIYLMPLLALGLFTSCEEEPFKGISQENPQEEAVSLDNLQISLGSDIASGSIDLNAFGAKDVKVLNITSTLPDGMQPAFVMELADNADFNNAVKIDVVNGNVPGDTWNTAFRNMLGRSPKAKPNYIRFIPYVTDASGNVYRMGAENTFVSEATVNVTPVDLGLVIENAYYLIGTCNGWDPSALDNWKFEHSTADVYDDPVFTISVEITPEQAEGGWWWKVVPQSGIDNGNVWEGIFGVLENGDESLSGLITDVVPEGKTEIGAGCLRVSGKYKMTINMEDGTYEFTENGVLYAIGDGCGWSHDTAPQLMSWNGDYVGFAYIESQVKFTDAPDWSHGDWGMGAEEGTLEEKGANIFVEAPGLYYANVSIANLTYSLTNISQVSMIGGFNSWGGDVDLTPNENFSIWTGTLDLAEGSEWKFRMNGGWDINIGGTPDNLVPDGANLWCEAGTHTITLDLSKLPYSCTIE